MEVYDPAATDEDGTGEPDDAYWLVSNPWAGLFQASAHNPQVIAEWFATGERTTVSLPDTTTTINQHLWNLIHDSDIDEMTLDGLLSAILTTTYVPESRTPQPWQTTLTDDFTNVFPALEEEQAQYDRENPTWKVIAHGLLDFAGLFFDPLDLAHSAWYLAEGNKQEAALGLVSVVPIAGQMRALQKLRRAVAAFHKADQIRTLTVWRNTANVVSTQKQARHVFGTPEYIRRTNGGADPVSYFASASDAQAVLTAFKNGDAVVLGFKRDGNIVVRVDKVTGHWIDAAVAPTGTQTNVFFIKGTNSASVVPYNPNYRP